MRNCPSCGTRLSPEALSCWRCGETARPVVKHDEPGHVPASPAGRSPYGPLTTASGNGHVRPLATPIRSGNGRGPLSLGPRGRIAFTIVVVVLAVGSTGLFLPYLAYTLVYGAFVTALSAFVLAKVWKTG